MLPFSYFLKVTLCSAAFFGYYVIALRNKKFHRYNRFFLLFSLVASWLVPLLQLPLPALAVQDALPAHTLQMIAGSGAAFELETPHVASSSFDLFAALRQMYIVVVCLLLCRTAYALLRVILLCRGSSRSKTGDVVLIETTMPAAPFSFFNCIFWNKEIDRNVGDGRKMWLHECTHVREKHSWDTIFLQINLAFGWFNPVFLLMKKELVMIHEFIADREALEDEGAEGFASMLLTGAFPVRQNMLVHPFFFSPVKRRLQMLLSQKNDRFGYLRRLIALPLLALLVVLFAFRRAASSPASITRAKDKIVLVLDAAHGGSDDGAAGADGTKEKDLTLAICRRLTSIAGEYNIEVVSTRSSDLTRSLAERTKLCNSTAADLFLSVHINQSSAVRDNAYQLGINPKGKNFAQSLRLANAIGDKLQAQKLSAEIVDHSMAYILNQALHPALLIECGNLDDPENMALLKDPERMDAMCRAMLSGIVRYRSADK